jgi:hypothetical protein
MQWTFANDGNTKDQVFVHVELSDTTLPARGDVLLYDTTDNSGTSAIGNSRGKRVIKAVAAATGANAAGCVEGLPSQIGSTTVKTPVFLLQAWGFHDAILFTTGAGDSVVAAGGPFLASTGTAGRAMGHTTGGITAAEAAKVIGFTYTTVAINQSSLAVQGHLKCL